MNEAKRKERMLELYKDDPVAYAALKAQLEASMPKVETKEEREERETNSRHAESVLYMLEAPRLFKEVMCRQCGAFFMTNYGSVSCCSDACRKARLQEIGIDWDPTKKQEERWSGRIPLVVPPEALEVLKQLIQQQESA